MTGAGPRPLALTMGEPAGIGGELTLMAWLERARRGLDPFVALDDPARLEALAARLGLEVPVRAVGGPGEAAAVFAHALPVLPVPLAVPPRPGQHDSANAPAVLESIRRAVALTQAGEAAAVVTNPIHKAALKAAGFRYPGHTEFLADLAGDGATPVMMLASPLLRVVPVTVHVSLRQAIDSLTTAAIVHCATVTLAALARDFGIANPRLSIAGLNPHAGESGTMGHEDQDIVVPAVAALKARGLAVDGPLPADTMFHERARAQYDAALCLYHDQALIPIKTLDFDRGVNVTLGLPFVRTSPDHGTAFDIAGTGIANPSSLIEALLLAGRMARRRGTLQPLAGA